MAFQEQREIAAGFASRIQTRSGRLSARLVRALLPPACLACGIPTDDEGALCAACWAQLRLVERPFCERLAIPFNYDLGPGAESAAAIASPPVFGRMRAVALYDGVARELVHALKYRDHLELAIWMARWMSRAGQDIIADANVIVPVPLHWRRLWWRRFNQSAALAQAIGRSSETPVAIDAVRRVKATRNQVGLRQSARETNVRNAFNVDAEKRIEIAGRRVLIVDDVCTTAATLNALARALFRAGARSADALVFARVADTAI